MLRFVLDLVTRNWTLKLTALLLATLLWMTVKAGEEMRVSVGEVPIEVTVSDPDWVLAAPPSPATAEVFFVGPLRELMRVRGEDPRVIIPVDAVDDSIVVRQIRTGWVRMNGDMQRVRVDDVHPSAVLLTFERVAIRLLPVAVRPRGALPPGLEFTAPVRADPLAVRVSGPRNQLEGLDSIPTAPIELGGIRGPVAIEVPLDTTGLGGLIFSPSTVDVVVRVGVAAPDTIAPRDTMASVELGPRPRVGGG